MTASSDQEPTGTPVTIAALVKEDFPPDTPARATRLFTHVLDDLVQIPGTGLKVGLDPILSIIPGAGTTVAALFGTVVLFDSVRLRAPVTVLARMVGHYVLDWSLGLIPFIGAFLDMAYRSNSKNLKLLKRTIEDRDEVARASAKYWIGVGLLALAVLLVILAVPVAIVFWLHGVFTNL